jgi:acetyltransferase, GNAT family
MNGILIREANQNDLSFVSSIMKRTLGPFYSGNQYVRAKNMFASVRGGIDYLAVPMRRVFIAEYAGKSAGFVSVVVNRLNRWSAKILALIVSEEYRGKLGIGSALLEHAKEFARGAGVTQLYCTVSELNQKTLEFFLRKGFCVAGMAREQYKLGIEEVMLYKPLGEAKVSLSRVEVVPFGDWPHSDRVFELIISQAGEAFSGIDERWVDELFAESGLGFRSRHLYVAMRASEVVGVVGVLPKDGSLVKLEPLVAVSDMALEALLVYSRVVMGIERKLYTHIVPRSWQVACLQRNGWRLEGIFPGEHDDMEAIQQWGFVFTDPLIQ